MRALTRDAHRPPTTLADLFAPLKLSDRMVNQIRWIARIWVIVAAIVFLAFGLSRGIPTNPDLGTWQEPVQLALLVLVSLGSLIAWRWEAIGATVISFGAIFLGVLATVENDPQVSFLAALVFLIPGVLFWFVWQRNRSFKAVVILAVTMLLLLASGGYASASVYNYLFGPTHPQSATNAPRIDLVEWVWSGGATPTSITVNTKLADDYDSVRLAVSQSADMSNAVYSGTDVARDQLNQRVVSFTVDGLTPNTHYFYAIEADGRLDLVRQGQFTSFPSDAASFSFAFASCARTGSNGQVFDAIREAAPLFYMNVGDIHYTYLDTDNPDRFRSQLDEVLTRPAQAALYRSLPIGYVWDDHDYGPNDGDRNSPTRDAARQVYQQYVPHYPLAAGEGDVPIYQAFTAGRVRFILTDTRSERDPDASVDDASKSMLGDAQTEWFKQQLLDARGRYPVIVWVNSGPWIDAAGAGKDTWGGFTTERRELANFIADNQIQGLLMVSGDAHSLAIDDGS
ncbi:MAG TPA: metallophosphoesterase family protein, partial [Thermomicrobiales bacterium]|nr:metallophosphoesterase family protein [Thermomicrobiales bacterium]